MTDSESSTNAPKRENIWLNLGLNVIIPSVLMSKGKDWFQLDQAVLLVVALAFPISYGIYDFIVRRKYNFFSVLGFVSILISGGVGLMKLDKDWIAIKEAAIPALFAVAVLVTLKTPFPLVRTFLYNPELFDVPKIEKALAKRNTESQFEKLMTQCTLLLSASFVLSAVLNYGLAKYLIRSETGTDEFVKEMGKMTAWSWVVITIPTMAITMLALMKLLKGIEQFTGYEFEDVMLMTQHQTKPAKSDAELSATEQSESDSTSDRKATSPETKQSEE